ncbi:MAG: hypothetical protein ACQEVA_08000 [Myxococcota bacterium]
MTRRKTQLVALLAIASLTQAACYNTYFIDKSELEKLESEVEQKEVVTVQADCTGASASNGDQLEGTVWAQAEEAAPDETATDATATEETEATGRAGCTSVPVSTANPVTVLTDGGTEYRVTPFNFMMSQSQLVSPEYDLLLSLNQVEGAEVQQFSTWKTTATIVGVSAVAIGSFIAISVLAPDSEGFQN